MIRIAAQSIADFQFRQSDSPAVRTQKLELLRQAALDDRARMDALEARIAALEP